MAQLLKSICFFHTLKVTQYNCSLIVLMVSQRLLSTQRNRLTWKISVYALLIENQRSLTQSKIFSLLELPALITAVVFGFLTAAEFRGGMLGRGMKYLAAGFLIMGLNHLHLQLISSFRFDLLFEIFGDWGANIAWFTLLIGSWLLLAAGFAELYRSGKTL